MLYKGASHSFLFSFSDLPLLWLAGGVSGQAVLPLQMQLLDGPEPFTYRGQAQKEGHDCVVLTVQEQHSGTAVREFWVDREKPYLIRYCRARDGDKVRWQLEADYKSQDGMDVPNEWTYTQYNHPGKLFMRWTYHVREIKINPALPVGLFEKPLEPGQVAFDVEQNKALEVNRKGELVPLSPVGENKSYLPILLWNAIAWPCWCSPSWRGACFAAARGRADSWRFGGSLPPKITWKKGGNFMRSSSSFGNWSMPLAFCLCCMVVFALSGSVARNL